MTDEQSKAAEAEPRTILVLVLGRCVLQGGKPGVELAEVTEEELEAARDGVKLEPRESMVYGRPSLKAFQAGAGSVYKVESPKDGTIIPSSATFRGLWPDEAHRVLLQVKDRASRTELERRKAEAKARRLTGLEGLEPIRDAYRQARGVHKSIILAQVVAYITGGGR